MIQASEIKAIADKARVQVMEALEEQIKFRADQGYNSTVTKHPLEPEQVMEIVAAGYKVIYSEANSCHQITW